MTRRTNGRGARIFGAGVLTAALMAGGCGGSYSPPPAQTGTPAASDAAPARPVTEKPFVSGGQIELQLAGGGYTIRPAEGNAIRVTVSGTVGSTKVDIATQENHATVSVKDTPRNDFRATIEVPKSADLIVRLSAGELKVDGIAGNKDIESNAGNVDVEAGDSKDYSRVDAAVQAGEINADAFGESRSGVFQKLNWSGEGKYTLRARLIAGNLTLRKH